MVAVQATGTTLTEIFGVGPVIAATVIGDVGDVARFASRDRFAAYNGTAPIEVSSGKRRVHRLSRRGNRRLNHAVHMTALTQVRYPHSEGRARPVRRRHPRVMPPRGGLRRRLPHWPARGARHGVARRGRRAV
jgi:transposase